MTEPWHKFVYTTEVYSLPDEKPEAPIKEPEADKDSETPGEEEVTPTPEEVGAQQPAPAAPVPPLQFKGTNARNILILVPSEPAASDLDLLAKILKAVGCDLQETAMMVFTDQSPDDILETLAPNRVLSFGIENDPWVKGEPYELQTSSFAQHLRADALPILATDTNLKRQLWSQIQLLFDL